MVSKSHTVLHLNDHGGCVLAYIYQNALDSKRLEMILIVHCQERHLKYVFMLFVSFWPNLLRLECH